MTHPEPSAELETVTTSPLFDATWYAGFYPDVAESSMSPWEHYQKHGASEGRQPNAFLDPGWYRETYDDLRSESVDPVEHYLTLGWHEGRDPGPSFSTAAYLTRYPEVAEAGLNPLVHFLSEGAAAGYEPEPVPVAGSLSPSVVSPPEPFEAGAGPAGPWFSAATEAVPPDMEPRRSGFFDEIFDPEWYRTKYSAVLPEMLSADWHEESEHFWSVGARRGHSPSPYFDVTTVRRAAHRLGIEIGTSAEETPFDAYVTNPSLRSISPCPLFDEEYYRRHLRRERLLELEDQLESGTVLSGFHHYLRNRSDAELRPHPLVNHQIDRLLGERRVSWRDALFEGVEDAHISPVFDLEWYRAAYPDIRDHIGEDRQFNNHLHHFLAVGMAESKLPSPDFDPGYYRSRVPGIEVELAAGDILSPVHHWFLHGIADGFDPNRFFDSAYYLERNPEASREIEAFGLLGAFEHFLLVGKERGYRCNPPLVQVPLDEDQTKNAFYRRARIVAEYAKVPAATPVSSAGSVSVVIPVRDNVEFTSQLLAQIRHSAELTDARVIVSDDGSTDDTRHLDRWFPDVQLVRNDRTPGFSGAVNAGIAVSDGDFILLLNNDIDLLPGAVSAALATIAGDSRIGAVGGPVIRTHGLLQEAGSVVADDGSCHGIGRDDDPLLPQYASPRDVDYCSGAFLLLRRAALDDVGLLDEERFSPGYFEEVDLCARLWNAGFRVVYCPEAGVIHHEFASFSAGRPPQASFSLQRRHRDAFIAKHKAFVRASGDHETALSSTRVHAPRALVIDDMVPLKSLGSGFGRTSEIVRLIAARGYEIDVFTTDGGTVLPREELRSWLPSFRVFSAADTTLQALLRANRYDIVWVSRPHNAALFPGELDAPTLDGARIVYDSEAIAATRTREVNRLHGVGLSERDFMAKVREELEGSDRFDAIVVVNDIDAELARDAQPNVPVHILSYVQEPKVESITATELEEREHLLFFGAFHAYGSPNYDSMSWFLREVFPNVRRQLEHIEIDICGAWADDVHPGGEFDSDGVNLLGRVPDLWELAQRRRVFVAPTRYAAGIPIKLVEAMAYGVPIVCSDLLAGQLDAAHETEVLSASITDPYEFADAVVRLYSDAELGGRLANNGLELVRRRFSPEAFSADLSRILGSTD